MNREVKYCPYCGNYSIIKWKIKESKGEKFKCVRCGKEFVVSEK